MGRAGSRESRSSPGRLLAALVAFALVFVGAALWFVLGDDPTADPDAKPDAAGPVGPVAPLPGGTSQRPPKPGPAPVIAGFGSVRGQVRMFTTREPVAGVPFRMRAAEGAPIDAVTGADGTFAFSNVPAGPGWELRGGRDGFAPLEITGIDLAPDQALDVGVLWLAVPVDLPAIVVDTTGRPIEGAEVAAFALGRSLGEAQDEWSDELRESRTLSLLSSPRASRTSKTDAQGRTTVTGLMPGAWRAVASAPGLAPASRTGILLVPGTKPDAIRFVLGPAHELEGSVRDEKGAPVAKARVIVARVAGWLPSLDKASGDTADDGSWRVEGLATGAHFVYVARAGRPIQWAGQVQIPETTRYDVRLEPAGTIRGRVTSEDGKPVEGADVRAAMQTTWTPMAVRTDKEGAFELRDVPAGQLAYFRVRADGFISHPEPAMSEQGSGESLRAGQDMVRDVVLRRGRSATIRVEGAGGPVEGAAIDLHLGAMWSDRATPWKAVTDAKGAAVVSGLLAGDYVVVVRSEGWVQESLPPQWQQLLEYPAAIPDACRLSVDPSADAAKTVRLTRGLAVTGRVVDGSGKPFGGATVTVDGAKSEFPVFSDADGRFRVEAVPASRRAVAHASAPNGAQGESEPFLVRPGAAADAVEIRLRDPGRLSGTVATSDGRRPVGAVVRWFAGSHAGGDLSNWPGFDRAERSPVSADGTFEIAGVAAGEVTVRADADGMLPGFVVVNVPAGGETGGVAVVLGLPHAIRGRVTKQGGAPIAGAVVTASFQESTDPAYPQFTTSESGNPSAQTDADGRFELRGLCPGSYSIGASAPGHSGAWIQTTTGAGDVLLELAPSSSITGFVRDPDGRPLGGVPVSAEQAGSGQNRWGWWGGGQTSYSAPDGSFEIAGLDEGAWNLRVSGAWQWGRDVNVSDTVKEGISAGARDVEIVVAPGLVIEGRVTRRDDAPVRVGWVSASYESGEGDWDWTSQRWVQIRPDGSFRIAGLKPGPYAMQAYGSFRADSKSGVAAGSTDVTLVVDEAFSISGVATDDRGLAVGWVNVQRRTQAEPEWEWTQVIQPGDGEFIVTGLAEGAYDLQFQTDGLAPTILPRVAAGRRDLDVRLGRGLRIAGTVLDAQGNAPPGAWVTIESRRLPDGAPGISDNVQVGPDGRFERAGLLAGEYRVSLRCDGWATCIRDGVAAGKDDLRLVLERGLSVSGTVVDAGGAGVGQIQVVAFTEDGGVWLQSAESGADGRFTLERLPSAVKVKLHVYGSHNGENVSVAHEASVEPGATDVRVELKSK